jgi:hypothetical protein
MALLISGSGSHKEADYPKDNLLLYLGNQIHRR